MAVTAASTTHGSHSMARLSSDELARLLELSQGFSESLDFQRVLDKVVTAARELLGTDMSTLLLLDAEQKRLEVKAFAGIDAAVARRLASPVGVTPLSIGPPNGADLSSSTVARTSPSCSTPPIGTAAPVVFFTIGLTGAMPCSLASPRWLGGPSARSPR